MKRTHHPSRWKLIYTLFIPLLTGMITAQIIATIFVYRSNMDLYRMTQAAQQSGYFIIPAGSVIATLTTFKSAAGGGLLYTLSIGIGLALASCAVLNLWQGVFKKNRWVVWACMAMWTGLILWINWKGWVLYPTLFCLLVPMTTVLTIIGRASPWRRPRDYVWTVPIATLVLLTGIWSTQLNGHLFITIRDHILLSNPLGRAINDFYYRYTLYAAESFKSLYQKSIRSYHLQSKTDRRLAQLLPQRLARSDMLHLPDIKVPDFTIALKKTRLILTTVNGQQIEKSLQQLLTQPNACLQELSDISDRYGPLRRLTLVCLLVGFPILLYLSVYGALHLAAAIFLRDRGAVLTASTLCLVIGILLFIPMLDQHPIPISKDNISQTLASNQWTHRVAALQYIEHHQIDIGLFPQYKALLTSKQVAERYWLARAMAFSHSPDTALDLKSMLKDNHPNVTCQVYYALGHRGDRSVIPAIQTQIAASSHWYTQWYGYRALRRLGWYPSPSN